MAKKQFKAESKRLLDMMINSIYTHNEIFLRELISNASDAIDKRYYNSLADGGSGIGREELFIRISTDKDNRTVTVSDTGCGMSKEELEENLGTIAKSGSFDFKRDNPDNTEVDIIGQFGVGFYSAFMVAKKVTVITRNQNGESFCWQSKGADGYTITQGSREAIGTDIILELKDDTEDENYGEFLEEFRLRSLVKKYSDYIRYPIIMKVEKMLDEHDGCSCEDEHCHCGHSHDHKHKTVFEDETLNSMIPIWKRSKSDISEEEMNNFYREKFFDYEAPLKVMRSSTEGAATYTALMFIPSHAPYNYYSKDFEKGLQLYASGVLIMDKCADLLPDYFSFVKGLVDSQDLSLNISREMLQHNRQLKLIEGRLEKKIKSELEALLRDDREKYEEFFKAFGLQLKYGIYSDFGAKKDLLKDLLLYISSFEKKPVTLAEYIGRMKEDQKFIYYACGGTAEQIEQMPQTELLREKGFEILYLTDDIDEFSIKMMHSYEGKEFRSISDNDIGIETDEEKEAVAKQSEEFASLLAAVKGSLGERVTDVRLSARLRSGAVCLSTEGGVSLEMEKVLGSMPGDNKVKARRVLELNPSHPVFEALKNLQTIGDTEKLSVYSRILYEQSLLIEGLPLEEPSRYLQDVLSLLK